MAVKKTGGCWKPSGPAVFSAPGAVKADSVLAACLPDRTPIAFSATTIPSDVTAPAHLPGREPIAFTAQTTWYPKDQLHWPTHILTAANDCMNESGEKSFIQGHLAAGRTLLLDSGIFWLTNQHKRAHGITMDQALALAPEDIDGFGPLFDRYVYLTRTYGDRLWGYIELDQGGAAGKRRTRARLEDLGLAPIPVYHPLNDGWDYFDELASSYDRICFGNIVQAAPALRIRLLHTLWERHRAYPDLWVHVLGLTVNEQCMAIPPDSCDSSTWIGGLRWGATRSETAMLDQLPDLGPDFAYTPGDPRAPGRSWVHAMAVCSDGIEATAMVWARASSRVTALTGQPLHPPYLPGEPAPCPG